MSAAAASASASAVVDDDVDAPSIPSVPQIGKPQKIYYCSICGVPPEYCEYEGSYEKCKTILIEKNPELYKKLYGDLPTTTTTTGKEEKKTTSSANAAAAASSAPAKKKVAIKAPIDDDDDDDDDEEEEDDDEEEETDRQRERMKAAKKGKGKQRQLRGENDSDNEDIAASVGKKNNKKNTKDEEEDDDDEDDDNDEEEKEKKTAPAPKKSSTAVGGAGVLISKVSRVKNKFTTVIRGLESFGVNLKDAAKAFSKKFAASSTVVKSTESASGQEVIVQGDVTTDIPDYIVETFKTVDKKQVYFFEKGSRKKCF